MSDSKIMCRNHGPLVVSGSFVLTDAEEKCFDLGGRERISLCRCGASENKPFCDGSHKRASFDSQVEARDLPPIAKN